MTRGMLVGHRRLAGSNKSSHYDHRLIILCAVGTLLARGAGLALRPHRDRKCRSTGIRMCAVGTLTARGAGLALRPHRDGKCRSTKIKILCSRINYSTAWYNKWCWKRPEAQKQIRPSYRFTERLGDLELAKLFRKEEERAKNEKQCFVVKIIFCWIISQ